VAEAGVNEIPTAASPATRMPAVSRERVMGVSLL
jgi:hypothetical protein